VKQKGPVQHKNHAEEKGKEALCRREPRSVSPVCRTAQEFVRRHAAPQRECMPLPRAQETGCARHHAAARLRMSCQRRKQAASAALARAAALRRLRHAVPAHAAVTPR